MSSLSIKTFIIVIMSILIFSESFVFYNFYQHSKLTINKLLTNSLQTDVLNLKHFLQKNLKQKEINDIISHLDNIIIINPLINDIHIFNPVKKVIYDSDIKDKKHLHKNIPCIPIAKIKDVNLFHQNCYSFSIKIYNGLTPQYYSATVSLNTNYINELLIKQAKKTIFMFLMVIFLFTIFLWIILKYYIIIPLERLRQYAYYSEHPPKNFFYKRDRKYTILIKYNL